jgi:hypothetical protein
MSDTGHIIEIGGPVDRIRAYIRIWGDDLEPEVISAALELTPTRANRRGDQRFTPRMAAPFVHRTGYWSCESTIPDDASPDDHLRHLLNLVEGKSATIRSLVSTDHHVAFSCSLFLHTWNRGLELSPDTLGRIAALGATLEFDIYAV